MAKKYAISGYYGFNNFGDELILSVICEKLKQENADITVFSVSPMETAQKYGVKSSPTFDILRVIKVLANTDVLISGGGSLFQDTTSMKSLLYYSFVLFVAQLFKKETVIYCQGVGPLNSFLSRFLVKNLFKKANFVSVRDEKSQKLLENWGIKSELKDDPAWKIEIPNIEKKEVLGVQLRECPGMNNDFLKNLAQAVSQTGFKEVKLFSLQRKLDYKICLKFRDLLKENLSDLKIEIVEDNLLRELLSIKMLVGMRFHALVVGIKSDAKCIAINYDPKIRILAEKHSLPVIELTDSAEEMTKKIIFSV